MASFNFQRFQQNMASKIEPPVRQHLAKVYGCLAGTTALATVGAYVYVANIFRADLLGAILSIPLILGIFMWRDNGKNFMARMGMLLAVGLLTGNSMGPLLNMAIDVNPQIIVTALVATSLVFVSFTTSALVAKRGDFLFLGAILMSALSYMSLFSIANIFLRSTVIYQGQLYIGLIAMSAFILYDTQAIMEKFRMGHRDPISHSLDLFFDVVSVFRKLVIILTQKENRDRRKRRD